VPEAQPLTFAQFREANVTRCEASFHAVNEWTPTDWATALAGEVGEVCHVTKKLRRLQMAPHWASRDGDAALEAQLADELADTVIYADLLAARMGIDLGAAIVKKFNQVSERVGSTVRLGEVK
jgi:NTP pyrophosphatase (non-canonical NTP hydrolase)